MKKFLGIITTLVSLVHRFIFKIYNNYFKWKRPSLIQSTCTGLNKFSFEIIWTLLIRLLFYIFWIKATHYLENWTYFILFVFFFIAKRILSKFKWKWRYENIINNRKTTLILMLVSISLIWLYLKKWTKEHD